MAKLTQMPIAGWLESGDVYMWLGRVVRRVARVLACRGMATSYQMG